MDHRQRVFSCLARRGIDRVPMDLWVSPWTSLSGEGKGGENVVTHLMNAYSVTHFGELLDALGVDFFRYFPSVRANIDPDTYERSVKHFVYDMNNLGSRYLSGKITRPLENAETVKDVETFPWPEQEIFDCSTFRESANLYQGRVITIQPGTWSPIFCKICELCGMEKTLMDLILNTKLIEALVDRLTDFYCRTFRHILEAVREGCDIVFIGDDYAGTETLIFGIDLWRKLFKPAYATLFSLIKSYGKLINFHCCGAMSETLPDLIEMGVDIINPIQPKAKGMNPERLSREFAGEVTFYGGIDVQELLPFGTPEQVRTEVDRVIRSFGKEGGYIMASAHTLLPDVPVENIRVMYDQGGKLSFL